MTRSRKTINERDVIAMWGMEWNGSISMRDDDMHDGFMKFELLLNREFGN